MGIGRRTGANMRREDLNKAKEGAARDALSDTVMPEDKSKLLQAFVAVVGATVRIRTGKRIRTVTISPQWFKSALASNSRANVRAAFNFCEKIAGMVQRGETTLRDENLGTIELMHGPDTEAQKRIRQRLQS